MRSLLQGCLFLLAAVLSTLAPRDSNAFTPPQVEQLAPVQMPASDLVLQPAPTVELRVTEVATAKTLALNSFVVSEVTSSSITELLGRNYRSSKATRALNHLDLK